MLGGGYLLSFTDYFSDALIVCSWGSDKFFVGGVILIFQRRPYTFYQLWQFTYSFFYKLKLPTTVIKSFLH